VVLGHSRCGAIKGACNHVEMGHLTGLLNKIAPALHSVHESGNDDCAPDELVERVATENMRHQMRAIVERSPILEQLLRDGQIGIAGGMYSVENGTVEFVDELFAHEEHVPAARVA
jgi:carbonic anhydrase